MTNQIKFTYEDDDGNEVEASLPAVYEVCDHCYGEGKHVNPGIDGNGITQSEMAELEADDEDFRGNYMSGMYDVQCETCHGKRVVLEIDSEHLTEAQKELEEIYWKKLNYESDYDSEREQERRFGCG